MATSKASVAGRAWRILRFALLWARKGGAFRRWRLMLDLRVALKSLRARGSGEHTERIRYMERQLSFDETPAFNFKMSRISSLRFPKIPCMTAPSVRLDEEDWIFFNGEKECEFFRNQSSGGSSSSDGYDLDDDELDSEDAEEVAVEEEEEEDVNEEEEGIDLKAEEFITKFYEQMKQQREVSWIEYNEMLHRGVN